MTRWRRTYGPDEAIVMFGVLFAFSCVAAAVVAYQLVVGQPWHGYYWLVPPAIAVSARGLLVGVLVSERGVRVRTFRRTHTVAWTNLVAVAVAPGGFWDAHTIWILTRRVRSIRTPIRRGPVRLWPGRVLE